MLFCFLAGTRLPCWKFLIYILNMFFTMFSCTFNKNSSKICKFGPFLAQKGNFKPLTLNNFDVCYFAFWLVQDFLIENFLFTILNMFFTMFSCTFNKKIPKSVNLAPFWPKTGILNLWLWIILMFVISLLGWYKTSLLKISYLHFSICSLQCFHVHLIKKIPKSVNLAPFWLKTGILNLWLWIILMFVILLFGWYKTSLLKISYLHSQYVLYNVFMYI